MRHLRDKAQRSAAKREMKRSRVGVYPTAMKATLMDTAILPSVRQPARGRASSRSQAPLRKGLLIIEAGDLKSNLTKGVSNRASLLMLVIEAS